MRTNKIFLNVIKLARIFKGSHNLGLIFNEWKWVRIDGLINTDMSLGSNIKCNTLTVPRFTGS